MEENRDSPTPRRLVDWLTGMEQPDNNEAISNIRGLVKLCACSNKPEHRSALKIAVSKLICLMETDRYFQLVFEYDPKLRELEIHCTKDMGYWIGLLMLINQPQVNQKRREEYFPI